MLHKMKLLEDPFNRIKNGTKTVEFRLYDEKRKEIKIGDKIEFSKLPDLNDKIVVTVLDLYQEKTFYDLFYKLYDDKDKAKSDSNSMYDIYSKEQEEKYGVLGIKIKLDIDDLRNQIEKYVPSCEQEENDKKVMLSYFDNFDDVLIRQNKYGHFTASSWVLNQDRTKVLMIYHNIYDSWAWTGGHAAGESDLLGVAIREVKEETGVQEVKPIIEDIFGLEIICVNGHIKNGEYVSSHVHLNVTYLLEASSDVELKIKEDENSGVKWVPIEEAVSMSTEPWMQVIYQKIIDKCKRIDI